MGESPFCPNCGADLTSKVRRRRRLLRNVDRGVRHGAAAAITLAAVVSVLLVVLSAVPADEVDGPATGGGSQVPEGALELGSGYLLLLGGFDGTFEAAAQEDGTLDIILSDDLSELYDEFVWEFRDVSGASPYVITKTEPSLSWIEPSVGYWTVTVYCSGSSDGAVYTGSLAYLCDMSRTYTWQHNGRTLAVSYSIGVEDYLDLAMSTATRGTGTLAAAASFVDPEGQAADLESRVWASYSSAFSDDRTSSDYAACLLSMVSSCFEEVDDLVLYGSEVRWAYPGETLFLGAGDSGDLAVLAASLLKAAGFDVALAKLPDMWAVGIAGVTPDVEASGTSRIGDVVSGETYWLCSVPSYSGLGLLPSRYSYDGQVLYYGYQLPSGYGVAVCS